MLTLVILKCPPGVSMPDRRAVPLTGVLTIGRSPDCTLPLPDQHVSREHCRIDLVSGSWWLRVTAGVNPVWVGKNELFKNEVQLLRVGDQLRIGGFELAVVESSADGLGVPHDNDEGWPDDTTIVDWDAIFANSLILRAKTGGD
ncbi:FHA domain-containing protein [Fluviicoccus keumensis]|uniref:FHA domain-containing protein n=2 Tax=Fluviicoccus keumensis TaxID=1435465 RepID=A0A4Q7YI46_9GAMM|nr:FHA domain-containing protein [Fluviicoccus keumensis]